MSKNDWKEYWEENKEAIIAELATIGIGIFLGMKVYNRSKKKHRALELARVKEVDLANLIPHDKSTTIMFGPKFDVGHISEMAEYASTLLDDKDITSETVITGVQFFFNNVKNQ